MSPKLASVAKSAPPPLAFLQNDALDFGRQDCQMCCQPIEQVPLCLVRRRIPDQPALGPPDEVFQGAPAYPASVVSIAAFSRQ